jgi:signal transduction histidine kinase
MQLNPFKLSISARTFFGFLSVILIFTALLFWSIFQLRSVGNQLRMLKRGYLPLTKLASQLEGFKLNMKADFARFLKKPSEQWNRSMLERLQFSPSLIKKVERSQTILRRFALRIPQQDRAFVKLLQGYLSQISRLTQRYQEYLALLQKHAGRPHSNRSRLLQQLFRKTELALRRGIRLLSLQMDFRLRQVVLQAERDERRAVVVLLSLFLVTLLISAVVLFINILPLRRIKSLTEMTEGIARGDYQRRVDIPSGDEIGLLAKDFNRMAHALGERDKRLAQQRQELEEAYRELQDNSDRLLRSERLAAIGRIAAQITHEIRNPLNAIGLNLELLEEDIELLPESEEPRAVLQATMAQVEHLTSITEEYLRFARLPTPQLEMAQANEMLQELMEFLSEEMNNQEVHWALELEPGLPDIPFDVRQIRQSILNLVRNAMEAASMHKDAHIWLRTRVEPFGEAGKPHVCIEIEDNGEGIPPEKLSRIFEPFFSTKEEGSGLGLYLTQQIIASHDGNICAESDASYGTRFLIRLPVGLM